MAHIPEVASVEVLCYEGIAGAMLFVNAVGAVACSDWSGVRLSPRYAAFPPVDGMWEFDLEGDPPCGRVL